MKMLLKKVPLFLFAIVMALSFSLAASAAPSADQAAAAPVVSFQSANGSWIKVNGDGSVTADAGSADQAAQFDLIPVDAQYFALKSHSNGKFVSFKADGTVVAIAASVSTTEKVAITYVVNTPQEKAIQAKALSNGKYVSAVNGGGGKIVVNVASPSKFETFKVKNWK
ncbi:Fascin domain-containing protein [Paenibacillus tianmuensis]|uniref:Fascin domain-containing protein n=1 Tax=Paenibacillus tianmuensis TaxID=624147 RepID=A0A1G4R9A0_9BACL|nr:fibroblast growth factor [Paenibacillus tianmuensis]SCW53463.1 Fascin domain-containing protein [Paenibacillus tianmuensis]